MATGPKTTMEGTVDIINYPTVYDVIMGSGENSVSHLGNVYFRIYIKELWPRYEHNLKQSEKTTFSNDVVGHIKHD